MSLDKHLKKSQMNKEFTLESTISLVKEVGSVYTKRDNESFSFEGIVSKALAQCRYLGYRLGEIDIKLSQIGRALSYTDFEKSERMMTLFDHTYSTKDMDDYCLMKYYACKSLYHDSYTGDITQAIKYSKLEMAIAKKSKKVIDVMRIKYNIGTFNSNLGFHESAIQYFEDIIPYFEKTQHVMYLAFAYANLGISLFELNHMEEAKKSANKALNLGEEIDEIFPVYTAKYCLANIYLEEGAYTRALTLLGEILIIADELDNLDYKIEVLKSITKLHMKKGAYKEALVIINSVLPIAKDSMNIKRYQEILRYKVTICEKISKFKEAFDALKTYNNIEKAESRKASEIAMNQYIQQSYNETLERLEVISKVGKELSTLTSVDEVLLGAKKILSTIMSTDSIGIGTTKTGQICFDHYFIDEDKIEPTCVSFDDRNSFAAYCIKNKEVVVVNDAEEDYQKYVTKKELIKPKQGKNRRIFSILYSPLTINDYVIGVFTIQSLQRNAYGSIEVKIFKIIADYIAVAVHNAIKKI